MPRMCSLSFLDSQNKGTMPDSAGELSYIGLK